MKKHFINILLMSILMIVLIPAAVFAEDSGGTGNVLVEGKPAKSKEAGWKDYYEYVDAALTHVYFEDAEGLVPIEDINAWQSEGGRGYLPPRGSKLRVVYFDEFDDPLAKEVEEGPDTYEFTEDGIVVYSDKIVISGETNEKIILDNVNYKLRFRNLTVNNSVVGKDCYGMVVVYLNDTVINGDIKMQIMPSKFLYASVDITGDSIVNGWMDFEGSLEFSGEDGATLQLKGARGTDGITINDFVIENAKDGFVSYKSDCFEQKDGSVPVKLRVKTKVFVSEDEYIINGGKPFIEGEEYEIVLPVYNDKDGNALDPQPVLMIEFFKKTDGGVELLKEKPSEEGDYIAIIGVSQDDLNYYSYDTGYYGFSIEKKPVEYKIIEGSNAAIDAGSIDDVLFVSDADFSKFKEVLLDGETLEPENYVAKEGSTEVSLKKEYVKTLAVGEHEITIVSTDGRASTKFTVHAEKDPAPATGDISNSALWTALAGVSFTGLAAAAMVIKKKRDKSL